eukprot:3796224-Amphidinium_carterae.1
MLRAQAPSGHSGRPDCFPSAKPFKVLISSGNVKALIASHRRQVRIQTQRKITTGRRRQPHIRSPSERKHYPELQQPARPAVGGAVLVKRPAPQASQKTHARAQDKPLKQH